MPGRPIPEPSAEGVAIIARVFRVAAALRQFADVRPALIITLGEAFVLLDHACGGPWQMEVLTPGQDDGEFAARHVRFDLALVPRPGAVWGTLFGVTLIVEDDDVSTANFNTP